MISNRIKKACLGLVVILFLAGAAHAGGLDYHHNWYIKVGGHYYSVAEIEDVGRPGVRFTRVSIRKNGRDFQCSIWIFTATALLVPLGGLTGLAMLIQRRQRQNS